MTTNILPSIFDDINQEAEALVISDFDYNINLLSNALYKNIKTSKKYRKIKQHQSKLTADPNLNSVIRSIFVVKQIPRITSLDKVFINCYYRKLLRAQIEEYAIGKELVAGLIITGYHNVDVDVPLVATIRYLRIVCKYLGIRSTTRHSTFPIDKLYDLSFWVIVSGKFVTVFGELVEPIETYDDDYMKVLKFLDVIFKVWSGSKVAIKETASDTVCVVPATYVTRLLPKMADNFEFR